MKGSAKASVRHPDAEGFAILVDQALAVLKVDTPNQMQVKSNTWNGSTGSLKRPVWKIWQQDEHAGMCDQHLVHFSAFRLCLVVEIPGRKKLVGLRQLLKEAALFVP